jgi:hypothetical protein
MPIIKTCPRVKEAKELGDKESIDVKQVIEKFRVSEPVATSICKAIASNQVSCGRDLYAKGLCRPCYNARHYDRSSADERYEKSEKGRARAGLYKKVYYANKKEPPVPEVNKRMQAPVRVSFFEKFGNDPDLSVLDKKHKAVIEMYYGIGKYQDNPHSLPEIGEVLGCSKQNVLVIRDKALSIL